MRPIDYTLISVSFVPLFEGTTAWTKKLCGLRRVVLEQGLVRPLRTKAAESDLLGL